MKASKLTDAQKAFIIKQGEDGMTVAEICRKAGIPRTTYYRWYDRWIAGGLDALDDTAPPSRVCVKPLPG